jgi:disease resistance protein RPM1
VTTRIKSVAEECSKDHEPRVYTTKHLYFETSKMLFYKRIFGSNDPSPCPELEQVSNSILKKYGGMPLAINSIAGILASKPKQLKQWEATHIRLRARNKSHS